MRSNLRMKIILALLAGGMLCANSAWAEDSDYTIKQGDVKGDSGVTTEPYTKSIQGNTDGSGLTVTGGDLSAISYTGNEVIIRRGKYHKDGYGAGAQPSLYGAYSSDSNDVTHNTITIYDGIFSGPDDYIGTNGCRIYGAYSRSGNANNNTINISGGSFNFYGTCMYGGNGNTNANYNEINISGGTFTKGTIISGYAIYRSAANNVINISDGNFTSVNFISGYSYHGESASTNTINIFGGNFVGSGNEICGCYSSDGGAIGNTVNIEGGYFRWL